MKKIINGKKYDTETAKLVGENGSCIPMSDFRWEEEELYQKKTGEFFLKGSGGPLSKYAESYGNNSWGYGDGIIPLSVAEAKQWGEKYLSYESYVELFGEPEE